MSRSGSPRVGLSSPKAAAHSKRRRFIASRDFSKRLIRSIGIATSSENGLFHRAVLTVPEKNRPRAGLFVLDCVLRAPLPKAYASDFRICWQSAIKSVYNDPKYIGYRPWNRTWAPGLEWQKDTWHIPEFFELLVEGQEQYDLAITGKQDTLDNIAAFQEKLLKEAGHIQE
jgi:hypothetical protein